MALHRGSRNGPIRLVTGALVLALPLISMSGAQGATISNTGSATYVVGGGPPQQIDSNTVSVETLPPPTPAVIKYYQYAPGAPGATVTPSDGGQCQDGAGAFAAIPPVTTFTGAAIDTASAPLLEARVFHGGEPIFITLSDPNRNTNPSVREFIEVHLSATSGDEERLRLQETGPDTGLFATAIQTQSIPPAPTDFDCVLSVEEETTLTTDYVDALYPTDTAEADILVDPFGVVFDSATGAPVNGATVTLINVSTGQPAAVFGDDGVSSYPATLTSGGSATDSSGVTYSFPPGGYRFPFVAPGDYRLVVAPPAGFAAPSSAPLAQLQAVLDANGNPYAVVQGSLAEVFTIQPGPALNIDLPVDAGSFFLQKTVSHAEGAAGDFLQYTLTVRNDAAVVAAGTVITDTLPLGLRYQSGSLRVDGAAATDPAISADGRTLSIAVGTIAPASTRQVSYVAQLGPSAPAGRAINVAVASAGGGLRSNTAQAEVRIREPFFSRGYTLIGRVVEGECDTPWDQLKGVADARLMLDNGTYVTSDKDGQFHFEGVRPGTRVVQLDLDSLPANVEVAPCIRNSRFAGRSYSQFVDQQGGSLWRTDFYVRRKPPIAGEVGIRVHGALDVPAQPPPSPPPRSYTLQAHFETLSAVLTEQDRREVERLIEELKTVQIERLEVIGHTDSRGILPGNAYKDNYELSHARANVVAQALLEGLDLSQVQASGRGPDQPVTANDTPAGMALNRRTEIIVHQRAAAAARRTGGALRYRLELDGGAVEVSGLRLAVLLPDGAAYTPGSTSVNGAALADPAVAGSLLRFDLAGADWTHWTHWNRVVEFSAALAPDAASCPAQGFELKAYAEFDTPGHKNNRTATIANPLSCRAESAAAATVIQEGARQPLTVLGELDVRPVTQVNAPQRRKAQDDTAAAGAETDWLAAAAASGPPGAEWLFPGPNHNPRAPVVRIVIKHAAGQTVSLSADGEPVSALSFDGAQTSADGTFAVSIWRGVSLKEGENRFEASLRSGTQTETLSRVVHYANTAARIELVPAESHLAADGIGRPVIAVRALDRFGWPVRAGITLPFTMLTGQLPAQLLDFEQQRALSGMDRFQPTARVETDDGVAYIELQPTTDSGTVALAFALGDARGATREQEIRAWLASTARDWVVVGFAEGTAGYNTLKDNVQGLAASGVEDGAYTDGEASFYAKGRVLGQWLLTMAYDSGKPSERLRREGLFDAAIDPNEFYTLYGDGAEQRSDAQSQSKLYLKLERRQFFALFGDYDTGLTESQLARYRRRMNGIKSEYSGETLKYTAYAAETAQHFARDEIQGNGTSGLYNLTQKNIVLNSERIRIETRDRLKSEQIVSSRSLARHLDYDIDYSAGTLFFREPIASRDTDFNPQFIVAEYETAGLAEPEQNAGGRVALNLLGGQLTTGLSQVHDESNLGQTDLTGADVKVKFGDTGELRLEGARSEGRSATVTSEGNAWLAEIEHRGEQLDALVYARRQEPGFGLRQQNGSETGMQKTGADAQLRITENVALQTQVFRQENLASDATRDAASAKVQYRSNDGGASLGYQFARDQAAGLEARSQQVTGGANQYFLDKKLELQGGAEMSLGGDNQSVDFPTRYTAGMGYALSKEVRLLLAQEITDGASYDSSTTRAGLQVDPWEGAKLTTTLNQSRISEYGPRTYGQWGLTQAFLVGENWGLDLNLDGSQAFNESGTAPIIVNPNTPVAPGGTIGAGSLTEDYLAVSGGLTYRAELWSWNMRAEGRNADTNERFGFTTGFLRQAEAGVAFAMSAQGFQVDQSTGAQGLSGRLDLSWAMRPLGWRYSVLDRLELRFDQVTNGAATTAPLGNLTVSGDVRSGRIINNLNINRVSQQWSGVDRQGNLFTANQRNQWSLYYGSKYVFDRFGDQDFAGYTDLLGAELRHDFSDWLDAGLQASVLHTWDDGSFRYSAGPSLGISPVENGWVTLGYNLLGFHDGDFDAARYTAQGPFLKLRIKFDQNTRLPGLGKKS